MSGTQAVQDTESVVCSLESIAAVDKQIVTAAHLGGTLPMGSIAQSKEEYAAIVREEIADMGNAEEPADILATETTDNQPTEQPAEQPAIQQEKPMQVCLGTIGKLVQPGNLIHTKDGRFIDVVEYEGHICMEEHGPVSLRRWFHDLSIDVGKIVAGFVLGAATLYAAQSAAQTKD